MPTPLRPHDAAPLATLKFKRTPEIGPPDPRVTPIPVRPEPQFPRVSGYDILSVVGYGGMGIVYEARHRELNRRVALKMLRGEALADPEYRERFRAEAEAIARLQHPNVIQVFEVGTVEPQAGDLVPSPFLALEFVDGGSLAQHTCSPQPPSQAARTVETLARAAHAAHQLGVVHRDLKPANVLLTRDGTPKIADFGIAKRIDAECAAAERGLTRDGVVMGTPEYMAPEQLHGQTASPTVDVYALGVILYELLTGRVPFQGATFADTMLLTMYQEPVPPRRLQPAVPRDIETICLKCLEKDPAKRYATAAELADDCAAWAAGRAIRARATSPAERTARWAKRNPAVAALSALALALAVGGLGGIVWQWNDANANARTAGANAEEAKRNADAAQLKSNEANRNADKERWERYRISAFAASSALRLHDATSARHALDAAPPVHRDWVWHQLRAQLDRSREVIDVGLPLDRAHFTPDGGRVLLRGHYNNDVRVWDLPTRTEFRPPVPLQRAHHTQISPDGRTVAQMTDEREVRLYDVHPWRLRTTLRGHPAPIRLLSFAPDGRRALTVALDHTVRSWNAETGEQLHTASLPSDVCLPLNVSADHRTVVTNRGGNSAPTLWDARTGRELARLNGHSATIRAFLYSPDGRRLVSVEEYPSNLMRLWEVSSGRLLAVLDGHDNLINDIKFSGDGSLLASVSADRTVRLWDLSQVPANGALAPRWVGEGHTAGADFVAISADNRRVISSSSDRTLRYWDAASGRLIAVLQGHSNWALAAAWSPDGSEITSASTDGTLRVWNVADLDNDYALRGHTNFVYGIAFHPDGSRVASSAWDGTARIWNPDARTELTKLVHTGPTDSSQIVSSVAYHPTGHQLATLCRDGFVRLWDAEGGKEAHRWPIQSGVWADSRLTFSPRGDLLAAGDHIGRVCLWDVNTRAAVAVLEGHTAPVRDVAFSPDGKRLASGGEFADQTVRVWDVATRKQLRTLTGHTSAVYALTWNRAGTLLASGATDDTVRLWDANTLEPVGEPLRQGASVYAVAFSPDGKLLAVGCADKLIRVWHVETRQVLAELSGHRNYVHALAFSSDGARLVSASGDKTVRVWDASSSIRDSASPVRGR